MSGQWRPPWYPDQRPEHNPWATRSSMNGKTYYEEWCDSLAPGELLRLIKAGQPHRREHQESGKPVTATSG